MTSKQALPGSDALPARLIGANLTLKLLVDTWPVLTPLRVARDRFERALRVRHACTRACRGGAPRLARAGAATQAAASELLSRAADGGPGGSVSVFRRVSGGAVSGNSGAVDIRTAPSGVAGASGPIAVRTGPSAGTGVTGGAMSLATGDAKGGQAGAGTIAIAVGIRCGSGASGGQRWQCTAAAGTALRGGGSCGHVTILLQGP
jgi:hypothetical protein